MEKCCKNCYYRDADGDCIWYAFKGVPFWLERSSVYDIDFYPPVVDSGGTDCDAFQAKE